jgi:hypothetical protein
MNKVFLLSQRRTTWKICQHNGGISLCCKHMRSAALRPNHKALLHTFQYVLCRNGT